MAASSFAVISTGGRQVKVSPGDVVRVDRIGSTEGEKVTFDRVLVIGGDGGPQVGTPNVEGASVTATVLGERRDRKVIVFKKKRRKGYRRTNGHRQDYTLVRIDDIQPGG